MKDKTNIQSEEIAPHIYRVSKDHSTLIYAPLKKSVFYENGRRGKIKVKLINRAPNLLKIYNKPRSYSVTFDMTQRCSMSCIYCSVNSKPNVSVGINFATIKICIDYIVEKILEENTGKIGVLFLGKGEPTLNWVVLKKALEYVKLIAQRYDLKCYRCVVTNGIISRDKIEYLSQNTESVVLSWDGPQEIQDFQRPLANGKPSFHIVEKTAARLSDSGAHFHIRPTITRDSLPFMKEMTSLFVQYHPATLLYQPLYSTGRAESMDSVDVEDFCEKFIEASHHAKKYNIKVEFPGIGRLKTQFCSAYNGSGFSITSNGKISACDCIFNEAEKWGEFFIYGEIVDGRMTFNQKKLLTLKNICPDKIDECGQCFAFLSCRGHCLNNHLNSKNDFAPLTARSNVGCEIVKNLIYSNLKSQLN